MYKINDNYLKLPGSYLFSTIGKKVAAYSAEHPEKEIIRLGIGDVTQPLAPAIIEALHKAVDEMGHAETFHGYAPDLGYEFLRKAIAEHDFQARGADIQADEIFVSDGAKCDAGNIQEIFSTDNKIAVCDPVYPVYVDTNVMAGRTGTYDPKTETWSDVIYMPCTAENGFAPELPKETPDLIYLCFPNNPTGAVAARDELKAFVDYAHREGSVIVFDSAYSDYIGNPDLPHSIYEIEGAEDCAIEIGSFSKNAGFTGVRLGWSIVPEAIRTEDSPAGTLHRLWNRRQCTFFNGASSISQAGGIAALSGKGREECMDLVRYYKGNASIIRTGIESAGLRCYGGTDSPYIWTECPDGMTSWQFFDYLLEKAHVAVTPGSGFGKAGEGYVRISSYGHREDVEEAVRSIKENLG